MRGGGVNEMAENESKYLKGVISVYSKSVYVVWGRGGNNKPFLLGLCLLLCLKVKSNFLNVPSNIFHNVPGVSQYGSQLKTVLT